MASSEELSRVFHFAPIALGLASTEGKLEVVNTAWETLMGFSAAELTSKPFFHFMHPDDVEAAKKELAQLLSGHTTVDLEARVAHRDGGYRWVQLSGRFDRSTNQIVAVAHEMVGATTEFTRAIVTAGPSAMFATDREGVIVMANAPMASLFGYTDGELIGNHITMLVPERFRVRHADWIEQFVVAGLARAIGRGRTVVGLMKDGTEFSIEIGLAPFSTPRGQFVLGSVIDMSERERHSRDLIEHLSELRALQQQMEKAAELSSLLQHAATEHEVVRLAGSLLPEVFPGRSGAVYLQPSSRDALELAAGWGRVRRSGALSCERVLGDPPLTHASVHRGEPHALFSRGSYQRLCMRSDDGARAECRCLRLCRRPDRNPFGAHAHLDGR